MKQTNNKVQDFFTIFGIIILIFIFIFGIMSKKNNNSNNKEIFKVQKNDSLVKKDIVNEDLRQNNFVKNNDTNVSKKVKSDDEMVVNTSGLLDKDSWYELKPRSFDFKIQFPNKPKLTVTDITTNGDKKRYTWASTNFKENNATYALSIYDIKNNNRNDATEDHQTLNYILDEFEYSSFNKVETVEEQKFLFNDFDILLNAKMKSVIIEDKAFFSTLSFKKDGRVYILKAFYLSNKTNNFEHMMSFFDNNFEFTNINSNVQRFWKKKLSE